MAMRLLRALGLALWAMAATAQTSLVEGFDTRSSLAKPLRALNQAYVDEAYGSRVRRVSDAAIPFDRDRPGRVRHAYSRATPPAAR